MCSLKLELTTELKTARVCGIKIVGVNHCFIYLDAVSLSDFVLDVDCCIGQVDLMGTETT